MALPYEIQVIDFARKEQKSDWYLKLNPNGRIPTLLDDDFPARGTREARPSARP